MPSDRTKPFTTNSAEKEEKKRRKRESDTREICNPMRFTRIARCAKTIARTLPPFFARHDKGGTNLTQRDSVCRGTSSLRLPARRRVRSSVFPLRFLRVTHTHRASAPSLDSDDAPGNHHLPLISRRRYERRARSTPRGSACVRLQQLLLLLFL